MDKGKKYYHLSIPNMAEWMDMKVLELEQYDDQEWCHRIVVEEHDTLGLYALNQLIRDLKDSISTYYDLSPSKGWKPSGATEKAWWVSVSKASDVRSITIQKASNGVIPNKSNCFKTEDEAKLLRVVIRGVFAKYGIRTEEK